MFKKVLSVLVLCLALTGAAFGQGSAGPASGSSGFGAFSAPFAQPVLSWSATGLTINYSAGSLLAPNATAVTAITANTLTATTNTTNYVYWSQSGASLSITTTLNTALAATPLYVCVANVSGNVASCVPYTLGIAPSIVTYTSCGTSASCASPTAVAPKIIQWQQVAFSASTTLALTGIPASFYTGTTSYACFVQDTSHPSYTFGTANQSATATTITASTSNSDSVNVTCYGN